MDLSKQQIGRTSADHHRGTQLDACREDTVLLFADVDPLRDTSQACYKIPRKPSCFSCRVGRWRGPGFE